MHRKDKRRLAIEIIDRHGRRALYAAFGNKGVCIPAARMVIEFCKAIDLPARVESVVAVVRNRAAKELGIWPELAGFPDVHRREYDRKEAIARGATLVIVGIDRPPTYPGIDKMPIHVVPVIGDRLIDLNLDCHNALSRARAAEPAADPGAMSWPKAIDRRRPRARLSMRR